MLVMVSDVRAHLPDYDVDDETVEVADRLATVWIKGALGLATIPDPTPETIWAAALELVTLVVTNPESLAQRTTGPTSRTWPLAPRRDAILRALSASWAREQANGGVRAFGSFPAPLTWPDSPMGPRAWGAW